MPSDLAVHGWVGAYTERAFIRGNTKRLPHCVDALKSWLPHQSADTYVHVAINRVTAGQSLGIYRKKCIWFFLAGLLCGRERLLQRIALK